MPNELTTQPRTELERREPANMLEAVIQAVRDPNVDPARLEHFLAIGRQLQKDQAEAQYNAAFAAMKQDLPIIRKNGVVLNKRGGVQFRFAKYDDIHKIVTPILSRHGFSTSFDFRDEDKGRMVVTLHLMHAGGHTRDYHLPMPAMGENQFVSNLQNAAAAQSFAKRRVLVDALDILTEDQDTDGAPVPPPERITEDQAMRLADMLAELGNLSPDFARRYTNWLKTEYGSDRIVDLFQGDQYAAADKYLQAALRKAGGK